MGAQPAFRLTRAADAPLSTSGSSNSLGREENAPARADTPVKRLCAIPQKCRVPDLWVAALMSSRLCFEQQIRRSSLLQKTSLSPCSSPRGKRGACTQAGLGDRCLAGTEGCPPRRASGPRPRLGGSFQGTIAQWEIPLQTLLAQEKPGQETGSKACFIAVGFSCQPPARPQPGRATAPWIASACRALWGLDWSWEYLRGTDCPGSIISTARWSSGLNPREETWL